jgi:hypothetical protein
VVGAGGWGNGERRAKGERGASFPGRVLDRRAEVLGGTP